MSGFRLCAGNGGIPGSMSPSLHRDACVMCFFGDQSPLELARILTKNEVLVWEKSERVKAIQLCTKNIVVKKRYTIGRCDRFQRLEIGERGKARALFSLRKRSLCSFISSVTIETPMKQ